MAPKSSGQVLVERIAAFISSFCYFDDPTTATVVALWALGTWVHEQFYSFPFLAVTAAVKGAGKTRVLELLKLLARQGGELSAAVELTSEPTPAAILALIRDYDGRFTLLWDEADVAASEKKGFLSAMVNTAYRQGSTIPRRSGDKVILWKSFCAIAFALIGDLNNTFRDRSIVVSMTRGRVERDFESEMAMGIPQSEAETMRAEILQWFVSQRPRPVRAVVPQHLSGRDREIWAAIFGLAEYCGLDAAHVEKLVRWSSDNAGSKTAEKRATVSYESELDATMATYAERALRDLARVMPEPTRTATGDLWSHEAVAAMKALADAPWRTFRGLGLDPDMLAAMVKRFGVRPGPVRMGRGRESKQLKGYSRKSVLASVPAEAAKGGAK